MIYFRSREEVANFHNTRRERGLALVGQVRPGGRVFTVQGSQGEDYIVDPWAVTCTCQDWERANAGAQPTERVRCKHLWAVYFYSQREEKSA